MGPRRSALGGVVRKECMGGGTGAMVSIYGPHRCCRCAAMAPLAHIVPRACC